jgi:DNA-binding SARP family transcriptional activator/tetratricopeptide (TPR) repeat protein
MLTISLLGEQAIDDDTGRVRARSSRTTALIGYLAIHAGTPQTRQRIAAVFWPDSTDAQALTNLRRELHHLRQLLGADESLEVTATDLCWRDQDTCRVDVRVLETARTQAIEAARVGDTDRLASHAARGIDAYGGDFLPTVYDDWVTTARDTLRRHCVELCDLLAQRGARHGDLRPCLEAARKRIELEPLEEVGYRMAMSLQAEMGDRAGAISTYHHCASVLERELGVSPDPATRRALERLIGPGAEDPPTPNRPRASTARSTARIPLVGRDTQLALLAEHWSAALRGRAEVGVVRGPPGVGKSRLVTELARYVAGAGAAVVTAQCFDTSGQLALAPVADWLRSPELRAASRALRPVWRQEVERLVPDLGEQPRPGSAGDRAMVDAWQRHRFFEGLTQAFLNVDRPMLLVLDNLQWCDRETLAWISFLLGLAPERQLMVAATLRDGDEGSAGAQWTARLRDGEPLVEVRLGPLSREDTAALATALTGGGRSEQELGLLHATTGGFPLYVIEASRATPGHAGTEEHPSGELGSVLRRRLELTSPHAQEVAGLAAAVGRDFALDLLTEASDLDADIVARSVDELWRSRIVEERGSGYDFSHDLLRDTAYEMVSPPRRWLLHRRLAQALELSSPLLGDDLAGALAAQYDRGGRPERALPYYHRAAEVAASRFALAEATHLHRESLRMVDALPAGRDRDRRELDCLLAMAAPLNALRGYASAELQAVLERAVELSETTASNANLVRSLLGLWASRFVQGKIRESHEIIARALSMTGVDDVLLGQAHFAYAGSAVTLGRPTEAVEHFDLAHERCAGAESLAVGSMPEVHALAWSAHAHWLLGEQDLAVTRANQAIERARSIGHPYSLAVALAYGAVTEQLLGDRGRLRNTIAELAAICDRYGFAYYREWGLVLEGWSTGGTRGLSVLREGIGNLRDQGSLARMPYWLSLLADAMIRNGTPDPARAALDAARTAAESRGDTWWLPEVLRMRAGLAPAARRDVLLASALDLAEEQGSTALVQRCRAALVANDGNGSAPAVDSPNAANAGAPNAANVARTLPS